MISLGTVPAGSTVYIPFSTYAGSTGASATCTGLAVTDVEIYKNGSTTQRASDAGIALLDTDGIDFDGITGLHGFSIDLNDNTDSGFYAVGSWYWVVVSSITVDSQTVTFLAAVFRIGPAEVITGYPVVDSGALHGDATAAENAEKFFDGTGYAGTNNVIPTVTDVTNLHASAATAAELAKVPKSDSTVSWNATALAAINAEVDSALNTAIPGSPTANSINERIATMDGLLLGTIAAGTHNPQSGDAYARLGAPAGASHAADVAAVKADTAAILEDTGTTLPATLSGLATAANLATVAGYLDTEIAAILADTDELQKDWVNGGRLDLLIDAIKAKTDAMPSAATISTQVASDLASAHGAGAWTTATGFSTHSAADVVTALGTGSTLTALATAANLATLDTLVDRLAPLLVGNVTGAGTGTEVYAYGGVTATVTVDVDGNVSNVVFS